MHKFLYCCYYYCYCYYFLVATIIVIVTVVIIVIVTVTVVIVVEFFMKTKYEICVLVFSFVPRGRSTSQKLKFGWTKTLFIRL